MRIHSILTIYIFIYLLYMYIIILIQYLILYCKPEFFRWTITFLIFLIINTLNLSVHGVSVGLGK